MRVLILNPEFPPLGGGAGNATYYLLRELAGKKDLEVDLLTSSLSGLHSEQFAERITIHYLPVGKSLHRLHYQRNHELLRYTYQSYRYAKKLVGQHPYDLVHAFFGIPSGLVAVWLGLPYIVSLRGSDVPGYNPRFALPDRFVFRFLSRWVWSKANIVVANSRGLRELAHKTNSRQEIRTIPNGVNADEFTPRRVNDPSVFRVLSVSRLIERKGIQDLLEGFARFNRQVPASRLVLVGEGNLREKLAQTAAVLGIIEKVEFRGVVPHDQLPEVYQSADVFVLPSLNEGMSNAVLEAMASGLPIVTTSSGGTEELVDDGNGQVIPMHDPEAIQNALSALYHDLSRRVSLGKRSRMRAEGLSWGQIADEYNRLYQYESRK